MKEDFKILCLIEAKLIGLFTATSPCHVLARVGVFPSCSAAKAPTGWLLSVFFSFFIIYCSPPPHSVSRPLPPSPDSPSSLVLVLEELVATDGYRGDECHELLEVTLCVAVGIQALHQAVQRRLVLHVLWVEDRGVHGRSHKNSTPSLQSQSKQSEKHRQNCSCCLKAPESTHFHQD